MVIPRILQIVPSSEKHNIIGGAATQHNTQTWQYTSSIITHNNVACEPFSTLDTITSYKTWRKGRWREPCGVQKWHTTLHQNGHHEHELTLLSDRSSFLYNMYPPELCTFAGLDSFLPPSRWAACNVPSIYDRTLHLKDFESTQIPRASSGNIRQIQNQEEATTTPRSKGACVACLQGKGDIWFCDFL